MRKLTYYAVFEPSINRDYGVYWPDLPGCISMGDNFAHAERMATEALSLHIYSMEQDGDMLPPATIPPFKDMPEGGIIMPITVFPDIVKNQLDNQFEDALEKRLEDPEFRKEYG